jgi:hypothetical protein
MVARSIFDGTKFPKILKSDGWMNGRIVDVSAVDPKVVVMGGTQSGDGPWIRVEYLDKIWVDVGAKILSHKSLSQWINVSEQRVRLIDSGRPSKVCTNGCPIIGSGARPRTGAIVVRWGDVDRPIDENRFDFAVSEKLIYELINKMHAKYDMEIFSIFISHTSQLGKISENWAAASLAEFDIKIGLYFLWGYVLSADLLDVMGRMESVGIVTRYPNHSSLYECITSKEYQPFLASNKALALPATLSVPTSKLHAFPSQTCREVIVNLRSLRRELWSLDDSTFTGGLVKIGNEWMGDGVRAFTERDIWVRTQSMMEHGHSRTLIFQDRISNIICEPRVFVINGKIRGIRYTWNEKEDNTTGRIHALRTCSQSRVANEKFNGDFGAVKFVESRIDEIVCEWNKWLICATGEVPVFVRIDFLVQKLIDPHNGHSAEDQPPTPSTVDCINSPTMDTDYASKFRVWTCELGEMGSSMVGFREGKDILFDAIVDSLVPAQSKKPLQSEELNDRRLDDTSLPMSSVSHVADEVAPVTPISTPPGRSPPRI